LAANAVTAAGRDDHRPPEAYQIGGKCRQLRKLIVGPPQSDLQVLSLGINDVF
jgi:hypothetical protein